MLVSKVSAKGQVTLPRRVRESLRAQPGDLIEYEVQEHAVRGGWNRSTARFTLQLSNLLTEWSSAEDEEAFRDL